RIMDKVDTDPAGHSGFSGRKMTLVLDPVSRASLNKSGMDGIFPRRFGEKYLYAARAEGVYIWDNDGKKYLDACGGAAVVSIGHGVREVVERIHSQASVLAYAHTSQFYTRVGAELAQHLRARFPGAPQNVLAHFTSGGSEATETAIKIVRQYWISRGESQR